MSPLAEFALAPNFERRQLIPQPARFRLDTANRCLWLRNDRGSRERIPLTPNALAVLQHLVERAYRFAVDDAAYCSLPISRISRVLAHIDDNLDRNISLTDLASIMGLSASRFSHVFKAAHGVAPYRYILRRRIEKAKTLLCNCDATIAAISGQVGFSSESRFRQIFVRYTGATPSAYRSTRDSSPI
jgi:AraC-like DNA-binding protein